MGESVILSAGEEFHLKRGKDHIIYAGMPSDDVYSIVQKKASGYQGYAWNLFYPRRRQDIAIDGVNILVESIAPEEIRFRIQ
jgi:hypothetical protein